MVRSLAYTIFICYLMSVQGSSSERSPLSGNVPPALQAQQAPPAPQAQQAPQAPQQPQQHDPVFNVGQALFARLRANTTQEYKNFKKLDKVEMLSQINAL